MKARILLTMTCLFGMASIANAQLSVDSLGGVYIKNPRFFMKEMS